jgi:hypothetical protein
LRKGYLGGGQQTDIMFAHHVLVESCVVVANCLMVLNLSGVTEMNLLEFVAVVSKSKLPPGSLSGFGSLTLMRQPIGDLR